MPDILHENPIRILLVEDSSFDAMLFEDALGVLNVPSQLQVMVNGQEAIEWLRECKDSSLFPDLILLDLNMPIASGFDVLDYIQRELQPLPSKVVVLTTSDSRLDQEKALALGASQFLTKPMGFDELVGVVDTLVKKPA